MEYAEGGELLTQVQTAPERRMDEGEARFYFRQLVEGVHHLHSQDLCHRVRRSTHSTHSTQHTHTHTQ